MTIIVWIILGLASGTVLSVLLGSGDDGMVADIIVGVLGAVAVGWLASRLLEGDGTALNFTKVVMSVLGAITVIALFRCVTPHLQ